jgi:hypothetical protein
MGWVKNVCILFELKICVCFFPPWFMKGIPQKIKSYPGVDKYKLKMPTLTKVRAFEKRVREIGGKTSYIYLLHKIF